MILNLNLKFCIPTESSKLESINHNVDKKMLLLKNISYSGIKRFFYTNQTLNRFVRNRGEHER